MQENNKRGINYFDSMERRYQDAPNFVIYLKPEQIQRSAKERIFREMVKGNVDYSEHGRYFQDEKFLENVLTAARDELSNNITIRNALVFQDTHMPGIESVIALRARYEILCYVFNILVSKLEMVKLTDDIGHLVDIPYILSGYRNQL